MFVRQTLKNTINWNGILSKRTLMDCIHIELNGLNYLLFFSIDLWPKAFLSDWRVCKLFIYNSIVDLRFFFLNSVITNFFCSQERVGWRDRHVHLCVRSDGVYQHPVENREYILLAKSSCAHQKPYWSSIYPFFSGVYCREKRRQPGMENAEETELARRRRRRSTIR